jgi:hypothetical protein
MKNYITDKYTYEALNGVLNISKVSGMVQLVPTTTSNCAGSTVLPILMKASSPSRRQKRSSALIRVLEEICYMLNV